MVRLGLRMLLENESGMADVGSGEEAIEAVAQHHPDVVLMDGTMPGMGGVEATRQTTAQSPHVKVVGLSMHEPVDLARTMRDAGAAGYVQKCHPPTSSLTRFSPRRTRRSERAGRRGDGVGVSF